MLGYGYWVVERREDGAYLGQVGFADFKRDMTPSIEGIPEMGWIFAPRGARAGAMPPKRCSAALAWADEDLGRREIVAIISPDNARSIRLAEKAGFSGREEAIYKGEPILLFRRPPDLSVPGRRCPISDASGHPPFTKTNVIVESRPRAGSWHNSCYNRGRPAREPNGGMYDESGRLHTGFGIAARGHGAAAPRPAQETGDAPPPEPTLPATVEGSKTFLPADFTRFAPRNALDMLRNVPGFTIREATQERDLGAATGNVLINGQRISGKSNDVLTELGRIPASNVVRIEIPTPPRSTFRACPARSPTSSSRRNRSAASSPGGRTSASASPIRSSPAAKSR